MLDSQPNSAEATRSDISPDDALIANTGLSQAEVAERVQRGDVNVIV